MNLPDELWIVILNNNCEYRLVCKRFERIIPINVDKIKKMLNKPNTIELLYTAFKNSYLFPAVGAVLCDSRLEYIDCDLCKKCTDSGIECEIVGCENIVCSDCCESVDSFLMYDDMYDCHICEGDCKCFVCKNCHHLRYKDFDLKENTKIDKYLHYKSWIKYSSSLNCSGNNIKNMLIVEDKYKKKILETILSDKRFDKYVCDCCFDYEESYRKFDCGHLLCSNCEYDECFFCN